MVGNECAKNYFGDSAGKYTADLIEKCSNWIEFFIDKPEGFLGVFAKCFL